MVNGQWYENRMTTKVVDDMTNDRNKMTQYLDQILPFLQNAPGWFKIWVYVLIGFVGLTTALASIFYLSAKDRVVASRSFAHFQIASPKEGDEIPLGEGRRWLVRGHFPVFEASDAGSPVDTSVRISVERLPDLESVPQEGEAVIGPTADGFWRARVVFPDEGRYRIVAIGRAGNQQVVREVDVECLGKAKALSLRIEHDREIRNAPRIPHLAPPIIDKDRLVEQLLEIQRRVFEVFREPDPSPALPLVNQGLDLIDPALLHDPDDLWLQNMRAYFFKNYAIVMRSMKREDEAARALLEAETMFKAILEQDKMDAGAWNGIGSVLILRGQPKEALFYIREALVLNPRYSEARHDEQVALRMIAEQAEPAESPAR